MNDIIKVMVIDDSLSIRLMLKKILASVPNIRVVASAENPIDAREKLQRVEVDVITLDVEMPQMDGITFLEKLMKLKPIPVVMISTLTQKGSETALKALELGAVEIIGKPSAVATELDGYKEEIISKIIAAAAANVGNKQKSSALASGETLAKATTEITHSVDEIIHKAAPSATTLPGGQVIAFGSSTGGTEVLRTLLNKLPNTLPPIVIVQHMSPSFTTAFANRLNDNSTITVLEAEANLPLKNGHAYIAPGDRHFAIQKAGTGYVCKIIDAEKVSRHRPAVDILFRSVANECGGNCIAAIFTGMGDDGAQGLKDIADTGGTTIAQDEASCVVFGMPKAAIALGAAKHVLNIEQTIDFIQKESSKHAAN